MSHSDEESVGPDIEMIVDRKGRTGAYKYFIKWEGYSQEYNSWEKREDLVEDGFANVVDEFDSVFDASAAASPVATTRRSRSKTPSRVSAKKKAAVEQEKEEEEEEEEEMNDVDITNDDEAEVDELEREAEEEEEMLSEQSVNESEQEYEQAQKSASKSGCSIWGFMLLLLSSIMAAVVFTALRLKVTEGDKDQVLKLELASTTSETIPFLLCLYAVVMYAPSTLFRNRVCAMLVWVVLVFVSRIVALVSAGLEGRTEVADDDKVPTYQVQLFTMGVWQFLAILVLYSFNDVGEAGNIPKPRDGVFPNVAGLSKISNTLTLFGFGSLCFVLFKAWESERYPFSGAEFIVAGLALAAFARSLARFLASLVYSSNQEASSTWLELGGAFLGTSFVLIEMCSNHPDYRKLIPVEETYAMVDFMAQDSVDKQVLDFPIFRLSLYMFAVGSCLCFLCSATFYRNHW